MVGINTPGEGDLSLESLLSKTPEEIREILEKCSVDELKRFENEAEKNGYYELVIIIRDFLRDKAEKSKTKIATGNEDIRDQLVGAMVTEQSDTTAIENLDDEELVKEDGKILDLWKEQVSIAEEMSREYGEKVDPVNLKIENNIVLYYKNSVYADLYGKNTKGQIEKIGSPDKVYKFKDFSGYESFEYLSNKKRMTIYNKNMEIIAQYDKGNNESISMSYHDENLCVLLSQYDGKYIVFYKGEELFEYKEKGEITEEWLEKNNMGNLKEKMRGYFDRKREEQKKLVQNQRSDKEKFKDRTHCEIKYEDDGKMMAIYNENGVKLFELKGIKSFSYPRYETNDGIIYTIKGRESDGNILPIGIEYKDKSLANTTLMINKTTGKKYESQPNYQCMVGKVISIVDYDSKRSKIFDDNFNFLGIMDGPSIIGQRDGDDYNWCLDLGFIPIIKEENKKLKYYIVSTKTGKIITEYNKIKDNKNLSINGRNDICRTYYEKSNKTYLIVDVPGKGVCQVEIP